MCDVTIVNADIYTPLQRIQRGYIVVENGVVRDIGWGLPTRVVGEKIDVGGGIAAPGFVDVHVHGYGGVDTCYASSGDLHRWVREVARHGVTAILPTVVSLPHSDLVRVCETVYRAIEGWYSELGARILGIHLEGPYINREMAGAHSVEYVREFDMDEVMEYIEASRGYVREITIAPEIGNALNAIPTLVRKGIIVSLGHSLASYEIAIEAIALGASKATHLYNAMPPLHHRRPGIALALLRSRNVVLELIADLIHVSPEMMMFTIEYAGPQRVALITDAISATELPDGVYSLGRQRVKVRNGVPTIVGSGKLAGTTLTMDRALRNAIEIGIGLQDALAMTSYVPAQSVDAVARERIGMLAPGFRGDIVILSKNSLEVRYTFVDGCLVFRAE